MAKDVITRFKLETTQYDSALRTASKELSDYAKTASNAGKDFDKFTKSNAEAARAFGNIATSATNSKEKVKELVGAYNEMARAYELLSKEQQQSDWGKAMAESLTKLQQRIKDAKEELYGLGNAVEDVKSKSSGLFGEGGLTGMMAVAGGNLLAKGVTMLAGELTDAIGKSIELTLNSKTDSSRHFAESCLCDKVAFHSVPTIRLQTTSRKISHFMVVTGCSRCHHKCTPPCRVTGRGVLH